MPLAPEHVAALRAEGNIARYAAGTFVVKHGEPIDRFIYVLDGEIETVNSFTGERHFASTLGPTQFVAEIPILNGGTGRYHCAPSSTQK